MSQQTRQCYSNDQLADFLDQRVDEHLEARIVEHLDSCDLCRSSMEKLSGSATMSTEIKQYFAGEGSLVDVSEFLPADQVRDLQKVRDMLCPSEKPEMLGRLGQYEVCGVIGRGSAGIVVKALDPRLNRFVAIKLLAPAYSNLGCSRRRFEREGRAIASVKDPHVMPIHAVDEYQGTPYIVMQYMPDGSMQRRINDFGPMSTAEVVCVGMQIAKGLSAAHTLGIVHRDVKPANVLLANGIENAVVTDFGLARVVDEATMTRSGSISGTPQYMSPEQAKGEKVDLRSDLFSLGSVMYAAATGHPPFKGESVFGVIKKVCEADTPAIRESNPDIAPWLEGFIDKLMAKNPDDRFESADEVSKLLALELAHLQNPTIVGQPQRNWWVRREPQRPVKPVKPAAANDAANWSPWKIATGALACALVVSLSLWIFSHQMGSPTGMPSMPPSTIEPPSGMAGLPLPPKEFLQLVTEEVERLEEFSNTTEATIDVASGGQLRFNSNLGTVEVKTHDQPTVKMQIEHSVKAENDELAGKLFKSVKINHDLTDGELKNGKDAQISIEFPTRQLTQEEIQKATDLEDLKEQLLIRNNSHHRNAKIVLVVPESFNVDLTTKAGSIFLDDLDGTVTAKTHVGDIIGGNTTGDVNIVTQCGFINLKDVGQGGTLLTHGGNIWAGDVGGDLNAKTHYGNVKVKSVDGVLKALSNSGNIEAIEVSDKADVTSRCGNIYLWKAKDAVDVECNAGNIIVNFVEQPGGTSKIKGNVGSIQIGYVEDCSFNIDAQTDVGKVSMPGVKNQEVFKVIVNDGKQRLLVDNTVGSIRFEEVCEDDISVSW